MKKIDEILKQKPLPFKTLLKGEGNIIVNDLNDEALLVTSAFLTLQKDNDLINQISMRLTCCINRFH